VTRHRYGQLVSLLMEMHRILWDMKLERPCWCGCTAINIAQVRRIIDKVTARLSAGSAEIVLAEIDAARALYWRRAR